MYCGGALTVLNPENSVETTKPQTLNVNLTFGSRQKETERTRANDETQVKPYDEHFIKDDTPVIIGALSLIAVISFNIYLFESNFSEKDFRSTRAIGNIIILIWRICATSWVYNIAIDRNRNPNWAWLAFFFPGITLVIIGSMKKLLYPYNYYRLDNKARSMVNNNIANAYRKVEDYRLALEFVNKAVGLDSQNHFSYDTRANIKYYLKDFVGSLEDFNTSIDMEPDFIRGSKYYQRAFVKKELGDMEGAIEDLNMALKKGNAFAQTALDDLQTK